jgi:hypothetical protein
MHGFKRYEFGKIGIIFKFEIFRAARRIFIFLPIFVRDKLGLPAINNEIFKKTSIFRSTAYKFLKNTIRRKAYVKEKKEKRERAKFISNKKIDKMISLFRMKKWTHEIFFKYN